MNVPASRYNSRLRRRCFVLIGATAVALIAASVVGYLHFTSDPTPGVSWRNYYSLRAGMTQDQVEVVLGGPPLTKEPFPLGANDLPPSYWVAHWSSESMAIEVRFGEGDRVVLTAARKLGRLFTADELWFYLAPR